MNDDLMRELHFGGGLNSKDETNAGAEGQGKVGFLFQDV